MEDGDTLRPNQQLGGGMALTEPGQKSQHVAQGRLLYKVLPVLCVSPVKNNMSVALLNRLNLLKIMYSLKHKFLFKFSQGLRLGV